MSVCKNEILAKIRFAKNAVISVYKNEPLAKQRFLQKEMQE